LARVSARVVEFVCFPGNSLVPCLHGRPFQMRLPFIPLLGLALLASGCDKSTTSPTTTTTDTRTPAAASVTESFVGVVPVGGASFYSISLTQYGTVNLTLNSVSGTTVPSTVMLGLAIGTPSGTSCTTSTTTNTAAGTTAQVTGSYEIGVYCAKVSDIGNLFAPATFDVAIAHP
jgi:hypothetical protein